MTNVELLNALTRFPGDAPLALSGVLTVGGVKVATKDGVVQFMRGRKGAVPLPREKSTEARAEE